MKIYKYLFCTIFIALLANVVSADDLATLNRKLTIAIENNINNATKELQFDSPTLNKIIEIEKPTPYQKNKYTICLTTFVRW